MGGAAASAAQSDGIAEPQARLPQSSIALHDAASFGRSDRDDLWDCAGAISEAVLGIEAHRIVPHRYEMRSIEPK